MDTYDPFVPFGSAHVITLGVIVFLVFAVPIALKSINDSRRLAIARVLAVFLVLSESGKPLVSVLIYQNSINISLPLHMCGVAAFLTAWMLWRQSYKSYEVVYFWGVGGGIPAMLTPDLLAGFPHPTFFYFFISHGLVLLGVMYATFVFSFRPTLTSVRKAIIATIGLMAVIYPINLLLKSNYMYLLAKPEQLTLMEFMGSWPWYILTLTVIGIVVYLICYLPFVFINSDGNNNE
jgi:hypothetical integral membrane protein (TIGR02206 family)